MKAEVNGKTPCAHCNRNVNSPRSRGLCGVCLQIRDIREGYPQSTHYSNRRGVGIEAKGEVLGMSLDSSATDAMPGSPYKLATLMDRAARGVSLFHPKDASADR